MNILYRINTLIISKPQCHLGHYNQQCSISDRVLLPRSLLYESCAEVLALLTLHRAMCILIRPEIEANIFKLDDAPLFIKKRFEIVKHQSNQSHWHQ